MKEINKNTYLFNLKDKTVILTVGSRDKPSKKNAYNHVVIYHILLNEKGLLENQILDLIKYVGKKNMKRFSYVEMNRRVIDAENFYKGNFKARYNDSDLDFNARFVNMLAKLAPEGTAKHLVSDFSKAPTEMFYCSDNDLKAILKFAEQQKEQQEEQANTFLK